MFALLNSRSRFRTALLALPLLAGGLAANDALAQAGANCVPGGTQAEVDACAVKKFQEADTALNIYYGDVMTALSAHERPELRQDQKSWQRTRRDYCARHTRTREGQPQWTVQYNDCLVQVTQARRAALSQWLHTGNPPPPEASLPPQR